MSEQVVTTRCDATAPPFLSVIVPVLNEAAMIGDHLARLQGLRRRGAEVVLVDGGSDDATCELATAGVDRLLSTPRGRARQMNAGAAASQGKILLFLHADTALPDGADHRIRQAIDDGALWGRFDVRIDGQEPLLRVVETLMNWRSRATGIATGDQAIFIRREIFEGCAGYPEIPLMEDIALSTRLKRFAWPACLRERVLTSGRRWRQQGILRTIVLMWRLRARFFFGADPAQLALRYGEQPGKR